MSTGFQPARFQQISSLRAWTYSIEFYFLSYYTKFSVSNLYIIISLITNTSRYYHWVKPCLFHPTAHIASEGTIFRKARFVNDILSSQALKTLEIWKLTVPEVILSLPYFQIMELCMQQYKLAVLIIWIHKSIYYTSIH